MTQAFDPRAVAAKRVNAIVGSAILKMRGAGYPATEEGAQGETGPSRPRLRVIVAPAPPTVDEELHREPEAEVPPAEPSTVRLMPSGDEPLTREQRRSRRKREVRAETESMKRITKRELEIGRILYPEDTRPLRPKTRAECIDGPRPCPYVSCRHHLYLDVDPRLGSIKTNFPDLEVHELVESCALDVADRGGTTLEGVGEIMNLTRERIRQVEVKALAKLERLRDARLLEHAEGNRNGDGKRRLPMLVEEEDEEVEMSLLEGSEIV